MMSDPLIKFRNDLYWLVFSFLVTILIAVIVCGWAPSKNSIDIHLHDTYFVLSPWTVLIALFLLVTFPVFILKEVSNGFGKPFPNFIIILSGFLLIMTLITVNKKLMLSGDGISGGWIAYPPLSALPDIHLDKRPLAPTTEAISNVLNVLQLMLTLALLFVSFRWGQKKRSS